MNKSEWLKMDYKQLNKSSDEDIDTIYKRFATGNTWIVQFNSEIQEDEIGKVYLTNEQAEIIFGIKE